MQFGEEIKGEFLLDKSVAFVNHGSYGPTPKTVMERRIQFMYEQENQPDAWFRLKLKKYYDEAVSAAAELLGGKQENIVLVENVTTGINCVIKGLQYQTGDQILIHSHTYNAVRQIVIEQNDYKNVGIVNIDIPIPLKSEDEIVHLFKKAVMENPRIKLAVIDHITSPSALIFPIKKIIQVCREAGILTLIDGAHAPGQLELNLEELGADFYSGNFHKWCYLSRACGFLWISPEFHHLIRPVVTSHGYKSSLSDQFYKLGTSDTSNQLTLPHALKFFNGIGGRKAITLYTDELLTFGQQLLSEAFQTEKLDIPRSMRAPNMALVRYPLKGPVNAETADQVTIILFTEYNVQGCAVAFNGFYWIRMSANVYNTKEDYIRLKDACLKHLETDKE